MRDTLVVSVVFVVGIAVLALVMVGLPLWWAERIEDRKDERRRAALTPPADPSPPTGRESIFMAAPDTRDKLLIPAPTVTLPDGRVLALFDWLRDAAEGDEVALASSLVREFYVRLLTDRMVAGYFPGDLTELRKHFTEAFLLLARDGLWLSTANLLAAKHAGLVNANGRPITEAVYDRVIATLVRVLREANVPDTPECMGRIGQMAAAAKPLIVAA